MLDRNILRFFRQWMQKERRKPLVIRGARQVGKTFAVNLFAKSHFKNVISLPFYLLHRIDTLLTPLL